MPVATPPDRARGAYAASWPCESTGRRCIFKSAKTQLQKCAKEAHLLFRARFKGLRSGAKMTARTSDPKDRIRLPAVRLGLLPGAADGEVRWTGWELNP